MRIISFNANGIRSAAKKGFYDWFLKQDADVLCVQELKAQTDQLTDAIFHPPGYHVHFACAEKKGYSGVAVYTKQKPDQVKDRLGLPLSDSEGRFLQTDFGDLSVISLYMPSGSSAEARQVIKMEFLAHYRDVLAKMKEENRKYILCGDWNIAHKNIDLKNWKSNQKLSGFLPEERAWLDMLFDELGFIDAFRVINQEAEQYTWWSARRQSRQNNVGWRIDYQILSPNLINTVKRVEIYNQEHFSDHAPLIMDYEFA
jgi:exodeoxyribonuclease III